MFRYISSGCCCLFVAFIDITGVFPFAFGFPTFLVRLGLSLPQELSVEVLGFLFPSGGFLSTPPSLSSPLSVHLEFISLWKPWRKRCCEDQPAAPASRDNSCPSVMLLVINCVWTDNVAEGLFQERTVI